MRSIILYGLKTCDTCRKARRHLDAAGVDYRFRDLRADGVDGERLRRWEAAVGWEQLLNRRSTTWRQLAEADRADLTADRAIALMIDHPTLIKRPVLEYDERVLVGYRANDYDNLS
ncbi:ArsC family reductase [Arhodomonas sp. AD133]|uniref:ArsC family reductase n=1 Tax=Arhodomonas sp. AD133 TaxID=3415009 RepID=UPI003EC00DEC